MNEKLTTSVVMATYNGEKYIIEQLKSLRDQTKLIDEVLIYDDGSQDKTADLIRKFIEKNKLDNWIFKVNEKNRGWRDNFMELLSAATKEIIFTCDQDDIWLPDKIEKMCAPFEKNKNISVLVSDYTEIIEETGSSAKLRKLKTIDEDGASKVVFRSENILLKRPGCVFAVKKEFVPKAQEYYTIAEKSAHDLAMWGAALIFDQLYYLPIPTIKFRRHGDSSFQKEVSTARKQNGIYDGRINTLKRFNVRLDSAKMFMKKQESIENIEQKEMIIDKMKKENLMRIDILTKKKLSSVFANAFRYKNKFNYAADFYHVLKLNRSKRS